MWDSLRIHPGPGKAKSPKISIIRKLYTPGNQKEKIVKNMKIQRLQLKKKNKL